ncbi:MAG: hypothetical protein JXA57_04280 [Armatimonadetes bacterium]|nr:hypothetical protein [Armatimonadota bacterium]
MPYLIQGDEFELSMELMQRLAAVMAESDEILLTDAMYQLRNSSGILRFSEREEADRVAARFTEMGFANFVVDELVEVPRARLTGPGGIMPEGQLGVVALGRLLLEERQTMSEERPRLVGISRLVIPIPGGSQESTVTRERTRYYLDLGTKEERRRVSSGALPRIVEVYTDANVSEAYLNEGVRSLARDDRGIRAFSSEREWERYVTWLYQLKYA